MKRYLLWLVLLLSLSANATVLAFSVRNRVTNPEMPLLSKVQLAPEQRSRVMELRTGFLAFRQANHARATTLRGQLAEALTADPPDAAARGEPSRHL